MDATNYSLKASLDFNQILNLIKHLSYSEKKIITEVLKKETTPNEKDPIETHFASENSLAHDWQLPEEDEAWKDL